MSMRTLPAAERLLALLPQIYRVRDHEQAVRIAGLQGFAPPEPTADAPEGPLTSLLAALGQQLDLLEAEVDWLYEDQFIETCADWVVPYIGALIGARTVDVGDPRSARLQVANAIRERRAKGTARALAGRAHAVMAAPAEAIEYAAHVAMTFNLNFPEAHPATTLAINGPSGRNPRPLLERARRVTELRDPREGGRFAPSHVGARVWLARSVLHAEVVPQPVLGGQPGRFRFDPLGRDLPLWARATQRDPDRARLEPGEIPGPIPLTAAVDAPDAYYGQSLLLDIGGLTQPLAAICFCDLSDDGSPDQWNRRGSVEELAAIRIDPRRGRFVLPGGGAGVDPETIRAFYHFGAVLSVGGAERDADIYGSEAELRSLLGERDRRSDPLPSFSPVATVSDDTPIAQAPARLAEALDHLEQIPNVLLELGGSTQLPASSVLPAHGHFELRGGDAVWPTLTLAAPWRIQGGEGSTLTLRGLRISGDQIEIAADGLRQLTLIDCTLVPGRTRLRIDAPDCKLIAVRCILGQVRVAPSVAIDAVDSVFDSGAADVAAIAASDDTAGGILWGERSTFIGDVRLVAFDEVSSCAFVARPTRSLSGAPVSAQRLQSGCVRFSAVPRGSLAPRRYRCFPDEADATTPEPVFATLTYGDPAYATLVGANADAVLTGAENGGEMGAGNRGSYQRRKRLLDRDLVDWVPFGMTAITELISDQEA